MSSISKHHVVYIEHASFGLMHNHFRISQLFLIEQAPQLSNSPSVIAFSHLGSSLYVNTCHQEKRRRKLKSSPFVVLRSIKETVIKIKEIGTDSVFFFTAK